MAANKDLREGQEITFADGVNRKVFPLTIRQLRSFMKIADKLNVDGEQGLSDAYIDNMVSAAAIALQKVDPDLANDEDALEDALDLKCFGALMAASMGNEVVEDPNEYMEGELKSMTNKMVGAISLSIISFWRHLSPLGLGKALFN